MGFLTLGWLAHGGNGWFIKTAICPCPLIACSWMPPSLVRGWLQGYSMKASIILVALRIQRATACWKVWSTAITCRRLSIPFVRCQGYAPTIRKRAVLIPQAQKTLPVFPQDTTTQE